MRPGRLFFQVLFRDDVVTRLDSLPRGFDLFRVEHERRSVADHAHDKAIRRFRKSLGQVVQRSDFLAVDLVHDAGPVGSEVSVARIGQDVGQDDHFRMLQVDLLRDEVIEIMPEPDVARLIRFDQIERERLK